MLQDNLILARVANFLGRHHDTVSDDVLVGDLYPAAQHSALRHESTLVIKEPI